MQQITYPPQQKQSVYAWKENKRKVGFLLKLLKLVGHPWPFENLLVILIIDLKHFSAAMPTPKN